MSQDVRQQHENQYEIIEIDKNDDFNGNDTITDFDSTMVQIVYSSGDETEDENESSVANTHNNEQENTENRKKFICCYCDFTTPVKFKFGQHMQNNHGFGVKPFDFYCRECKRQFASWTNFRRHKTNVHNRKKKKDLKCAFCDFKSTSRTKVR